LIIPIDDSTKTCEAVDAAGVKSLVFTTDLNKSIKTNVERVDGWAEVYEKTSEGQEK
jgi:hypothetical protein